jgi:dolichyl-phosphate-mannose--protein O-mannosyl transferase
VFIEGSGTGQLLVMQHQTSGQFHTVVDTINLPFQWEVFASEYQKDDDCDDPWSVFEDSMLSRDDSQDSGWQ